MSCGIKTKRSESLKQFDRNLLYKISINSTFSSLDLRFSFLLIFVFCSFVLSQSACTGFINKTAFFQRLLADAM